LITVGIGILDYKGFRHIAKVPRSDAAIMIIVLLVTVFLDLLTAVGIGMVMAAVLFMKKMSDISEEKTTIQEVSSYTNDLGWVEDHIPEQWRTKVFVKSIEGPLFFGFAAGFQRMAEQLPSVRYVIMIMDKVPFIDQTGLYALEESILSLEQRGIDVLLTGMQDQPESMLRKVVIIPDLIAENHIFARFDDAIAYLMAHKEEELKQEDAII
jgi:SulP family sulfate permease